MKTVLTALAFTLTTTSAFAGGIDEPIIPELEQVTPEPAGSAPWLIPLVAVAALVLAASDS